MTALGVYGMKVIHPFLPAQIAHTEGSRFLPSAAYSFMCPFTPWRFANTNTGLWDEMMI